MITYTAHSPEGEWAVMKRTEILILEMGIKTCF